MFISPSELYIGTIESGQTISERFDIGTGNNFSVLIETLSANGDISITYECSRSYDGIYISPASNVILNNCKVPVAKTFSPVLMQFVKIFIYNNGALPVDVGSYFMMQKES